MASILSNLREMIQGDQSEEDFDSEFIYWWDDVQTDKYVEVEDKSLMESIEDNLVFVLHLAIILPIIPLVIISISSNFYLGISLSLITIAAVSLSYLLIRNRYVLPHQVIDDNVKLIADFDLTGNDELLFSKESDQTLAKFDEFRQSIADLFRSYEANNYELSKNVERSENMITNLYRNIDQINLSIDNTVGSTANHQEIKGYLSQVSIGIDNLTESFDSTLGSITEISNTLRSIGKQTNMLALNAGIEAAKAGIRGRGFDVVASNLRRLSDHATDSSNKIEARTDDINAEARKALEEITSGMTALEGMLDVNHTELTELNNELYSSVQDLSNVGREFGRINSIIDNDQKEIKKYRY